MPRIAIVCEFGQWQVWLNGMQMGNYDSFDTAVQAVSNQLGRRVVIEMIAI